jgi:hypothetical protein
MVVGDVQHKLDSGTPNVFRNRSELFPAPQQPQGV